MSHDKFNSEFLLKLFYRSSFLLFCKISVFVLFRMSILFILEFADKFLSLYEAEIEVLSAFNAFLFS
jgi:hypothetical protein